MLQKRRFSLPVYALFFLLLPVLVQASDLTLERGLQTHFKKSRILLTKIERAMVSGEPYLNSLNELKGLGDSIRSDHQALVGELSARGVRLDGFGGGTASRHAAMQERYEHSVPQYLVVLDALQEDQLDLSAIKDLKEILEEILPRKTLRIHGTVPYHQLNLPARTPVFSPEIVPAYKGGGQTFAGADLAPSPEAPITPIIAELAESLHWNPVDMYEWVKNNIRTEWYWGGMKGAEETLHQRSGNDVDQAALLVALFRSAGFPARYVRGVVEYFPDIGAAGEQIGLDDPLEIARFFQKAGIPYETVIAGGRVSNIRVEHIWVEVEIPYDNYRGAVIDEHGKRWLALDTTIKVAGYTTNIPAKGLEELGLAEVRESYLSDLKPETPLEYLAAYIDAELDGKGLESGYDDLRRTRILNREQMQIIPDGLQCRDVAVTGEYASLPDELLHKARLSAASLDGTVFFDQVIPLYRLSNRSIAVNFEPETIEDQEIMNAYGGLDNTPLYLIHLRPILTVDGARELIGRDGLAAGSDFSLAVELIAPAASSRIENNLVAGYPAIIGISAQQVVIPDAISLNKKNAERLLFEQAMSYIDRVNKAEEELASLLQMSIARPLPTLVTLSGVLDVVSLLGTAHGFVWKGVYLDADLRIVEPVGGIAPGQSDPASLFMQLASLQGSILESRIFEDGFGVESVSTAKLMALAQEGNIPLLQIDAVNIETDLSPLDLPESINDDIANAVNRGFVVTIPQTELLHQDWSGFAYIKESPVTYESGWMLSGEIAGGMTALNPDLWPQDYADILANSLVESTDDPLAAVELKVIKGLDILAGTAGQVLKTPLQVVALDRDGKRVQGVEVIFKVRAGGGRLHADFPDWLRELKVTTGYDGIAEVDFLFAESTNINPAIARRATDRNAQKVDETVIEVMSTSNGLQTAAPVSVYGFPDVPHHLRIEGGNVSGSILSWESTLIAYVVDQNNNPINGQNVDFSMGQARITSSCPSSNNDTRGGLLVSTEDSCMNSIPVYGECGNKTTAGVTGLHIGAAAHVILGGLPGAEYPITITFRSEDAAISSETVPSMVVTVSSKPLEVCNEEDAPYSALALKVIHATDAFGNIINGGATDSIIPLYARMYFIREQQETQDKEIACEKGEPDNCPVAVGTGEFYIDTDFVTASVKFDGTEAVHLGDGLFRVDYPLSTFAGKYEIPVLGEATELIKITADSCDPDKPCQLIDEEKESPPLTHHTEVCAVDVLVSQEKRSVPVNEDGYALYDTVIEYTIEPAEYSAATAYFVLEKEVSPGKFEKIAYLSSHTSGKDEVTFLRGFRFDPDTVYRAHVVLNEGSDYMEVKSKEIELIPLMLELDADMNRDGMFNEDDPHESIAPGLVVPLNRDDDDKDGVPDYLDGFDLDPAIPEDDSFSDPAQPDLTDDDLLPVKLSALPADLTNGTVTLTILEGQDKVRILTDNTKKNNRDSILIDTTAPEAATTASPIAATYEWQLGSASTSTMQDLPPFIYVEGIQGSDASGDIRLAISFTPDQGTTVEHDVLVLTVVKVDLKVDENRDGKIIFDDPDSPERKYTFWVNNDHDMEVSEEGEWHEDDEKDNYNIPDNDQDCKDNYIGQSDQSGVNGNKRDLEDFAMIQLRVPREIYDLPGLTYSFKFEKVVEEDGSKPSINLFKAVSELNEYLFIEDEATDQINEKKLLCIISDDETPIAKEDIFPDGEITPFIFEGVSKGAGDLKFLVKNGELVVFETSVRVELHDIRWFYDEFKVDVLSGTTWQAKVEQNYHHVNQGVYTGNSNEYFLFVHGWNMEDAEKKRWAETTFKRLWWQGYKGKVGLFNWPCLIRPEKDIIMVTTDPHNFNNSEYIAWQSGESLSQLLRRLKVQDGCKLTMLAHSQGNVVAGEALALYDSLMPVDIYIASQAALSASFYDNSDFLIDDVATTGFLTVTSKLFSKIKFLLKTPRVFGYFDKGREDQNPFFSHYDHDVASNVGKMFNFYNEKDYALRKNAWELNNVFRPEYGMEFIRCDSDDESGDYDIFEERCDVNGNDSGERFVNEYLGIGDGDEPDYILDLLDLGDDLDRYKIFSYVVHSRKRALGSQNVTRGGFVGGENVNLNKAPLSYIFNKEHYSHSRQFRSNIVKEKWYWERVMNKSGYESSLK